jgi:hypothetical protein
MLVNYAALFEDLRVGHSVMDLLDAKLPAFPSNATRLLAS